MCSSASCSTTSRKDAEKAAEDAAAELDGDTGPGAPAMQLMPYEKYDYVVLVFRNSHDWDRAVETFGLGPAAFDYATGRNEKGSRKVGYGRVVDGAKAMERLCGK